MREGSDDDLLTEMMAYVANRMMDLEVENLTGAAHGEFGNAHGTGCRPIATRVPNLVAHNSLALDLVVPRVHNATKRDYKVAARPAGTKE